MAFTEIIKTRSSFRPKASMENVVSVSKYKGASPHIHLSSALAVHLGWVKGNKAKVSVGTGSDYGWLRVEKHTSGFAMSSTGGQKTKAIKIGVAGILSGVTHASITRCTFNTLDNGALLVKIPDRLLPMDKASLNGVLRQQPFEMSNANTGYVSPRAG